MYEFYNGSLKKISFDRELMSHDGRTTRPHKEEMNVEVKPGFSEETVLTFPNKGNEGYAHKPSNLKIKFKEIPHECYIRKGNDLIYTYKISLADALETTPINIVRLFLVEVVIENFGWQNYNSDLRRNHYTTDTQIYQR